MNSWDALTDRDAEILRENLSEKIDQLRPLTEMGIPWRDGFEASVDSLRAKAGGMSEYWPERGDLEDWALAHEWWLREGTLEGRES